MDMMTWADSAACRTADPETFFSEKRLNEAAEYCVACPVRQECYSHAVHYGDYGEVTGTWGGEWFGVSQRKKAFTVIVADSDGELHRVDKRTVARGTSSVCGCGKKVLRKKLCKVCYEKERAFIRKGEAYNVIEDASFVEKEVILELRQSKDGVSCGCGVMPLKGRGLCVACYEAERRAAARGDVVRIIRSSRPESPGTVSEREPPPPPQCPCGNSVYVKGWCRACYNRVWRAAKRDGRKVPEPHEV